MMLVEERPQLAPLVLTADQDREVARMTGALWADGGALNASDMGTGKTVMMVETGLRLGAQTILVSAPLHTRFGWYDTVMRQTNYAMPFEWITNSTKAGKAAFANLKAGQAGVYFVGRELFRTMDWRGVFIDLVVHDECQTIANRDNKGYKVAFDLRARTKYTICQSATWYGSRFENAWGIGRILYPTIVERNFYKWVEKYCATVFDPFTPTQRKVVGEKMPGRFTSELSCYVNLRNTATQKPMVEEIFVDLSPRQRKLYDEFEQKGVVWLNEHPMVADVPAVIRIRLRQLTLAECDISYEMGRDGEMQEKVGFQPTAKSTNFDALTDFLKTLPEDEKVIIATDFAKYARMVAGRLGDDAFAWTGEASSKQREAAKGRFIKGKLKYLVAVQKAISEGTDGLQEVCHILVVLSDDDSPVQNMQMVGRVNRTGQAKRVLVYLIRARNTVDDVQAPTLLQKEVQMRRSMKKDEVAA